jgi:hypothetical protein
MTPTRIDYHGPDHTNPWEGKDARRAIVWDIGEATYTRPPEEDRAWLAKLVRHALTLLDALEAAEAERDRLEEVRQRDEKFIKRLQAENWRLAGQGEEA